MESIKLKKLGLSNAEILTREQMKNILGKMVGGSDGGVPGSKCGTPSCGKWVGGAEGHWEAGTCAMGTAVGGLPAICGCSNGGTGCTTVD